MNKQITAAAVTIGLLTLALVLRPMPISAGDYVKASQVKTDSVHVYGDQKFIGCPHLMYRGQEPTPVAVETLWTGTLEGIQLDIPFTRERVAVNWRSNFEKPILIAPGPKPNAPTAGPKPNVPRPQPPKVA